MLGIWVYPHGPSPIAIPLDLTLPVNAPRFLVFACAPLLASTSLMSGLWAQDGEVDPEQGASPDPIVDATASPGFIIGQHPLMASAKLVAAPFAQEEESQEEAQDGPSLRDRMRERNRAKLSPPVELRRPDGSVILPGEIPKDADALSRASWQALVDSMRSPKPMQSFQLAFNMRYRSPEKKQTNDLKLYFSYLAPSFVRSKLESGRTLLRGPEGDYLIDGDEVLKLVGREFTEDKKQLDQMASIAGNFVGLTNPVALRLVDLDLIEGAPTSLHPQHKSAADKLTWLQVTSPDFYVYSDIAPGTEAGPVLYRAQLGIDNETRTVHMALIQRVHQGAPDVASSTFVKLSMHRERAKLAVPHSIELHSLDPNTLPARFRRKPDAQLGLDPKRGRLHAELLPEFFLPPE